MLRWLRNVFRATPTAAATPAPPVVGPPPRGFVPPASFVFQQEDYCLQQLLPAANAAALAAELATARALRARDNSDYGFEHAYEPPPAPVPLAALGLRPEELLTTLGQPPARRYARVLVADGPDKYLCPDTYAAGDDGWAVLFEAREYVVQTGWLQVNSRWVARQPLPRELLTTLGRRYGLLLVDWVGLQLVDLTDAEAVARYLAR